MITIEQQYVFRRMNRPGVALPFIQSIVLLLLLQAPPVVAYILKNPSYDVKQHFSSFMVIEITRGQYRW